MPHDHTLLEGAKEARLRMARHLAELHRLHLGMLEESRSLKKLTTAGHALAEIEIAAELIEQYLAQSAAFLENMRGRCEARLPVLRRAEPMGPRPDQTPGHGAFWLAFSRLCAALRRAGSRTAS